MRVTVTGIQNFDVQLKKFAKRIEADVGKVRDRAGLDIFKRTVQKTPRHTGRLAGSWNWAYHGIDPTVKPKAQAINTYPGAKASGMRNDNPWAVLFITNALPYAARIEFEGWSKIKAPQGMLRLSIEEVKMGMIRAL